MPFPVNSGFSVSRASSVKKYLYFHTNSCYMRTQSIVLYSMIAVDQFVLYIIILNICMYVFNIVPSMYVLRLIILTHTHTAQKQKDFQSYVMLFIYLYVYG